MSAPALAEDIEFGHERTACLAWDIHLRYMLEQRVKLATLSSVDAEAVLDEVRHASRLCLDGRFRSALDRFGALFDLLSGEAEEHDEQG